MTNWKRVTVPFAILSIGVVSGCQTPHAANMTGTMAPVTKISSSTKAGVTPKSAHQAANTVAVKETSHVSSKGPSPIRLLNNGTLAFEGIPQTTSSTASDAVAPVMRSASVGYAALNGQVLQTNDGGKSFHNLATVPANVRAIDFTNASTGFVVTQTGGQNMMANQTTATFTWAIYRTEDGGKTWFKVWTDSAKQAPPQFESDNARISMYGKTGYVLMDGHFLTTVDGGATWKYVSVSGTPTDAVALSATDVWVATTDAKVDSSGNLGQGVVQLLHSNDGGKHFTAVVKTNAMSPWETKLSFDGHGRGIFLVKDLGNWATTIYWTKDAGQTWNHVQPALYQGRVAQGEPVFGAGGVAWIAMDPGAAPFPGGVTTFNVMTGKATQQAQLGTWRDAEVGSVQGNTVYAQASLQSGGKALMKSTNGGKTWTEIYPVSTPNVQVQFATPTVGLGVGAYVSGGAIYRTTDGGLHWTTVKSFEGLTPSAVAFETAKTAYVSAYKETNANANAYTIEFYVTHDGGTTWTHLSSDTLPATVTKDISEPSVQTVLSAHNSQLSMYLDTAFPSYAMTSTDGGKMWKTIASFQSKLSIDNAAYDGPNDLWISDVSQNHIPTKSLPSIYTTTLWNLQGKSSSPAALWTLPKGWTALGIDRVSSEDVYVYATRSLYDMTKGAAIFSTHNGGASWTEWETKAGAKALNVPVPLNLYPSGAKVDMSFPNAQDGYMLTGNGLLKTTDGGATWTYLPS